MSRFVLSPRAQADLDEIWDFTAARWDDEQAERYIRELWHAIQVVAGDPRRGQSCDDVRYGYRKYAAGSHMLYYRMTGGTVVDVVRILHQSMDAGRYL